MTGGRSGLIERAVQQLEGAVRNQDMTHDGSWALTRHVLNARRRIRHGKLGLGKESDHSPRKIDAAVAAVLAWQARLDAVSAGVLNTAPSFVPRRIR
jgi:phage terminase large subunit-like protein